MDSVASIPITEAPPSLALKAAVVPEAPIPTTTTSASNVSSSPCLAAVDKPACFIQSSTASLTASRVAVAPDTTSISPDCASTIFFARPSAASAPYPLDWLLESTSASVIFPSFTVIVTFTSPFSNPCAVAVYVPSFASVAVLLEVLEQPKRETLITQASMHVNNFFFISSTLSVLLVYEIVNL